MLIYIDMIVTGRDFRANQSKYIGFAHNGEDVILKSRAGSVRLIPVDTTDATGQELNRANTDKWYYAYAIDNDTITIQDACHAQNMHE
jgi:hypothetical protein